jgi:hypothetical protein
MAEKKIPECPVKKIEDIPFKERVMMVQSELYAPKNQFNKFGNYRYRNCEDIYNAVKPLLKKYLMTLRMVDELVFIGERYYVKTTAWLEDIITGQWFTNSAYAREEETKKGSDGSQITGASSSYARKYALNGLFLIDDVKDSDTTNTETKVPFKNEDIMKENKYRSWLDDFFYRHPDRKVKFLNYYRIETLDELDSVLTLKDIDSIITRLKKEEENK